MLLSLEVGLQPVLIILAEVVRRIGYFAIPC